MSIHLLHPPKEQQPASAALAREVARALPDGAVTLSATDEAEPPESDLVVAVFSLRQGSFAPTVARYRDLRNKKVAFVAILAGPVDAARVRKSVWGSKKQFCGNQLVGAYLCPADDDAAWGRLRGGSGQVPGLSPADL
ncbi:hypothetical protein LJB86_01550 [Deltaproteobacteria bacterium OttesenSCG-928-M10]|nr:hypothetical protein [Deltaproteobacteria bacterium OttesenSCG-928-M10]